MPKPSSPSGAGYGTTSGIPGGTTGGTADGAARLHVLRRSAPRRDLEELAIQRLEQVLETFTDVTRFPRYRHACPVVQTKCLARRIFLTCIVQRHTCLELRTILCHSIGGSTSCPVIPSGRD